MEDVIVMQHVKIMLEVLVVHATLDIQEMVSHALVCFHEYYFEIKLNWINIDINECSTNNGGCSSNALCTNTQGSFSCACNSGYSGNGFTCNGDNFFF